jgi:plasmid replication initiation protein
MVLGFIILYQKMKQELVVKSNTLLQHPIYKNSLGLKLFTKIILEVRKNPDEEIISFEIKDLLDKLDCNKADYSMIKKVADSMDRRVDINEDKDQIFSDTVHIFRRITIHKKGFISFKVEEDIKPYILNLTKNFTQYFFKNIARLNSSYSIRLYEFLKQYEKMGSRKISIIELRHFLNIEEEKYRYIKDFRKYTILVAQKELEEKTDIYFEFTEIKTGRKITDIEFFIHRNEKNVQKELVEEVGVPEEPTRSKQQEEIYNKMLALGVKNKTTTELLENHTLERLNNNVRYVESELKKGRNKDNVGGFLVSAIAGDFYNQTDLFREDEVVEKVKIKKEKEVKERLENQESSKRNEEKKHLKRKKIKDFMESLTEEEVNSTKNVFYEENKNSMLLRKYLKNSDFDIEKPAIKFNFYEFIFKTYIED